MEYTKEWINKVNRGGLFPLNDQFFIVIEIEVQIILPQYVTRVRKSDCRNFQVKVIDQVCSHDDVQWYWTLLSTCIVSEDHAIELLREIVTLFVTIRGFSLATLWLEMYKAKTLNTTKKSHGLRKNLRDQNTNNFISMM